MSGNLIVKDKGSHICSAQSDSIGSLQFDKQVKSRSYSSQFTLNDQILVSVDRREQIRSMEDTVIVEVDLSIGICKDIKSSNWNYSDIIQLDEMANQNTWVKKMTTYDTFIDKDVLDSIRDDAMEPNKLYLMKHKHKQQTSGKISSSCLPETKPLRTVATQFNPSVNTKTMDVDKFIYPSKENSTVNVYLKLKNQVLRNELIIRTGDIKHNPPDIENQYFSTMFMDFSNNELPSIDDNNIYIDNNSDKFIKREDHDAVIIEPIFEKDETFYEILNPVDENIENKNTAVEDIPFAEETENWNHDLVNNKRNNISKSLQYFLPAFDVSEINEVSKDNLDIEPVSNNSRGDVTTDDNESSNSITDKRDIFEKDDLESLNPDDFDESIMGECDQQLKEMYIEEEHKINSLEKNLYAVEYLVDLDDIICQENLVMQFQQDNVEDIVSENGLKTCMIDTDIDVPKDKKRYFISTENNSNGIEMKPDHITKTDKQKLVSSKNEAKDLHGVIDFNKISMSSIPYKTKMIKDNKVPISLYSDRKEKFLNSNINSSLQFFKQISDDRRSPVNSRCSTPSSEENTQSSQKNEFSTNSSDNSMIIKDVSSDEPHIFFARSKNYVCEAVNEESEEETEHMNNEDSNSVFSTLSTTEEIPNCHKSNSISDNLSVYSSSTTVTVNEIVLTDLVKKPIDSTPGHFEEFLKKREVYINLKKNEIDTESSDTEDTSLSSSDDSKNIPAILRQGESIEDIAKYLMLPKHGQINLKRSSGYDSKLNVMYNQEVYEENHLYPNKSNGRNLSPSSDDNTSLKVSHSECNVKTNTISGSESLKSDLNFSNLTEKKSSIINSSESEFTVPTSFNQSTENKENFPKDFLEKKKHISTPNLHNKPNSLPNLGYQKTNLSSDSDQSTSSENLPRRKIIVPISKDKEKVKIHLIQPKIVSKSIKNTTSLENKYSSRSISSSENNTSLNNAKNSNLKSANSSKSNSSKSFPTLPKDNQLQKNKRSSISNNINRKSDVKTNKDHIKQKAISIPKQGISSSSNNMDNNKYSSTSTEESLSETELKMSTSKYLDKKETDIKEKHKNKIKLRRESLSSNSNSSKSISTSDEEYSFTNKLQSKPPIYIDRQEKIVTTNSIEKKTPQLPLIICVSPPSTTSRDELSFEKDLKSVNQEYEDEKEMFSDNSENSTFSTSSDQTNSKSGTRITNRLENINYIQTDNQNLETSKNKRFASSTDSDSSEFSMLSKDDSFKKDCIHPGLEHSEKQYDEEIPKYKKNKKHLPVLDKGESDLFTNPKIKESISRSLKINSNNKNFSIDRREKFTNLSKSDLKADIKRSTSVPQYFEHSLKDPILSEIVKRPNIITTNVSQTSKSMSNILDENFAKRNSKCLSYELISVVLKDTNQKPLLDKKKSDSSSEYSISTSDDSEDDNLNCNKPLEIITTQQESKICGNADKESKRNASTTDLDNVDPQKLENQLKDETTSATLSISTSSLDHITSESDDDEKKETKYIDRREKILCKENNPHKKMNSRPRKIISDSTDEDISFSLTNLADDNIMHIHAINDNSMDNEIIKKEIILIPENKENTESTLSLNSSSLEVKETIKTKNDKQAFLISRSSQTLPMKRIEKMIPNREKSKSLEKPLTQMNLIPIRYNSVTGSLGDIVESRYHEYTETWSRQSPIESNKIKNPFQTDKVYHNHSSTLSNTDSLNKKLFTEPLTNRPRPVPSYLSPINAFPYIPSDQEFGSTDSIVDAYSADCNENEFITKYKSLPEFVSSLSNSSLPKAAVQTKTFNKKIIPKKKSLPGTINLNYGAVENMKSDYDKRKVSLTSVTTDSSYLERPILKDKKQFNHCASSDSLSSFTNGSSIQNMKPKANNMISKQMINHQLLSSTSSSSDSDTEIGVQPTLLPTNTDSQISQIQFNGKIQPFSKTNINNKEKAFQHSKSLPAKQISSSSESSEFSTSSDESD